MSHRAFCQQINQRVYDHGQLIQSVRRAYDNLTTNQEAAAQLKEAGISVAHADEPPTIRISHIGRQFELIFFTTRDPPQPYAMYVLEKLPGKTEAVHCRTIPVGESGEVILKDGDSAVRASLYDLTVVTMLFCLLLNLEPPNYQG